MEIKKMKRLYDHYSHFENYKYFEALTRSFRDEHFDVFPMTVHRLPHLLHWFYDVLILWSQNCRVQFCVFKIVFFHAT